MPEGPAPHHPTSHPRLLLAANLAPDQVAALSAVARLIAETPPASRASQPDADLIAAVVASTIAPINPGGAAHQFTGTPAQTYARLLRVAALAITQAGRVAESAELAADPMHGFEEPGSRPQPAIVCGPCESAGR